MLIEVLPDNDIPTVADDGPFVTDEDVPLLLSAFELFADDGDPDGDVLNFGEVSAEGGTVRRDGEDLLLTPDADYAGPARVRDYAGDGKGGVSARAAVVEIAVIGVADAPTAVDDRATVRAGESLSLTVAGLLLNDFDGDGDPIRFLDADLSAPAHGVLTLQAGVFTYVPEAGFVGEDSFTYRISDDRDGEAEATVRITVVPDNDPPTPAPDAFAGVEDTVLEVDAGALLANDTDPDGDPPTLAGVTAVVPGGRAQLLPGGRIAFTPDADVTGPVAFSYSVTDGVTAPVSATVTVTFAPVNDAPRPLDDFGFATDPGEALEIGAAELLADDRDPEGDAITVVGVSAGAGGTVALDGDRVAFTPAEGFTGFASFACTVADPSGETAEAEVSVAVGRLLARADSGFVTDEDVALDIPLAVLFANDAGAAGPLALDWADCAQGGTVALVDPDTLRFTPFADYAGPASFRYQVGDGTGRVSATTVQLRVEAVADAPRVVSAPADRAVVPLEPLEIVYRDPLFEDPDGDPLTLTAALEGGGALPGWLAWDGDAQRFSGTPPIAADGAYRIEITASDGGLSTVEAFTLTVLDTVGDVIEGTEEADPLEGGALADAIFGLAGDDEIRPGGGGDQVDPGAGADVILGTAAELDGMTVTGFGARDAIVIEGAELPAEALVATEGSAVLSVDLDGDLAADLTMTLLGDYAGRVFELAAETGRSWITVSNLAPVASPDAFATDEATAVAGNLFADNGAGADLDTDGDALVLTRIEGAPVSAGDVIPLPSGALVTVGEGGAFEWDPNGAFDALYLGQTGVETFAYSLGDGEDEAEGLVTIAVAGIGANPNQGGATGPDALTGGETDDTLSGEGGDDTLDGGAGDDQLLGGTGNDSLLGGEGEDTLRGGSDDDTLDGGPDADALFGDAGNDVLIGGDGDDSPTGGDGDDDLSGDDGDDLMEGGAGADTLSGGEGDDTMDGGTEADELYGGLGADRISGGDGDDLAEGGAGADVLFGDAGADTLRGGDDRDRLSGGDGADLLQGEEGDDILSGGEGDDTLEGGAGMDVLSGGIGDDRLVAAPGPDRIAGGAGLDVFVFALGDGTGNRVMDFAPGEDLIEILDGAESFAEPTVTPVFGGVSVAFGDVEFVLSRVDPTVLGADPVLTVPAWPGRRRSEPRGRVVPLGGGRDGGDVPDDGAAGAGAGARLGGGGRLEPGARRRGGVPGGRPRGVLPRGAGRGAGGLDLGGEPRAGPRLPRPLHLPAGIPGAGGGIRPVAARAGPCGGPDRGARRGAGAAGQLPKVGLRPRRGDLALGGGLRPRRGPGGAGDGGGGPAGADGARRRRRGRAAAAVPGGPGRRAAGDGGAGGTRGPDGLRGDPGVPGPAEGGAGDRPRRGRGAAADRGGGAGGGGAGGGGGRGRIERGPVGGAGGAGAVGVVLHGADVPGAAARVGAGAAGGGDAGTWVRPTLFRLGTGC